MVGRIILLVVLILLADLIIPLVIRKSIGNKKVRRDLYYIHYAVLSCFVIFSLVLLLLTGTPGEDPQKYRTYMIWMDVCMLLYVPKWMMMVWLFPLALTFMYRSLWKWPVVSKKLYLTHKYFWIIAGVFFSLLTFFILTDGMIRGTHRFAVKKVEVTFPGLPEAFHGFTIAQVSDIHLGSWGNKEHVVQALQLMQDQYPDLIVVTGDLINVNPSETEGFENEFRQLTAFQGKFAVLGNHDMGDFARLDRNNQMNKHSDALERFYHEQGFTLLRNEHQYLRKGYDSILIVGVDNWGLQPFTPFGNLEQAMKGIEGDPFTILLSHDPHHWRQEVLPGSKVHLTLSGHTHSGQILLQAGNHFWSPIQYLYHEWMGLYSSAGRYLYVSPGLGFVGFTGRLGTRPEISLITLLGEDGSGAVIHPEKEKPRRNDYPTGFQYK